MTGIFDYIFLRAYNFFAEKGDTIPDTKSAAVLSLIQFFTLLDIFALLKLIFQFPYPNKLFLGLPVVLLALINTYHYEKVDIQKIKLKWVSEEQRIRVRNGWIISVYLAVIVLIPLLIGTILNS